MLFGDTPRVVFSRNPLTEVICQLRFPPILQIVAEEPAQFQNQVRDRYPLYQKENGLAGVPDDIQGLLARFSVQLPGVGGIAYRFKTEDESREIVLSQEAVSVSEHNYTRWEQFRAAVVLAMQTTEAVYRPAFYSRVGLRYQNLIDRAALGLEGVDWDELLQPSFVGILAVPNVRARVKEKRVQFLIELDQPEACYATIRHGLEPQEAGEPAYLIDADFFTTQKRGGEDALHILDQFHSHAGDFFRWVIRDRLTEALGPTPVGP
jgi:uncharacterized protein (TIGR04255 family)